MSGMPSITAMFLVLARLGSILVFVPIPGIRSAPGVAKVLLAVSLSITLLPSATAFQVEPAGVGQLVLWLVGEMTFGLTVGLVVGSLSDGLVFGLQSIAVQAGFSYASTIDPNSEADSGVLQALAQIASNLLFLQFGGDGLVIRAFSQSLVRWPPGSGGPGWPAAESLVHFGSAMLELGVRLAIPVAALLLLADISLALMARIQSQLQLLSLAFPVKMLGSLAFLAMLLPAMAILYRSGIQQAAIQISRLVR